MKDSKYIEDEFVKFYDSAFLNSMSANEFSACESFYVLCISESSFTLKQAAYMKAILKKYYPMYDAELTFKKSFRTIDNTKTVYVKEEEDNKISIAFKFPYAFLETFDKEFETSGDYGKISSWDPEEKVRKIDFSKADFLKISDFVNQHGFVKEADFLDLESDLQEAINDQENVVPYAMIDRDTVELRNADESATEYFNKNKKNHRDTDALLAKVMGFPISLIKKQKTVIENIITSKNQFFWTSNYMDFFQIVEKIKTKTCIIIDRDEKEKKWLKDFVESAKTHIPDKKIKICFREAQEKDQEFNQWIKENGLGGKVDQGDIYIFQHKLPKWILNEYKNMLFVATTMINPPSNTMTQDFFLSHPCVIHLGEIRPTAWRNRTIVQL